MIECRGGAVTAYDWHIPLVSPSARYRALAYGRLEGVLAPAPRYSAVLRAGPPPRGCNWWAPEPADPPKRP